MQYLVSYPRSKHFRQRDNRNLWLLRQNMFDMIAYFTHMFFTRNHRRGVYVVAKNMDHRVFCYMGHKRLFQAQRRSFSFWIPFFSIHNKEQ